MGVPASLAMQSRKVPQSARPAVYERRVAIAFVWSGRVHERPAGDRTRRARREAGDPDRHDSALQEDARPPEAPWRAVDAGARDPARRPREAAVAGRENPDPLHARRP